MVVGCPISFTLILIMLQLFSYWYGPLAVLCVILAIDVALSAILYAIL